MVGVHLGSILIAGVNLQQVAEIERLTKRHRQEMEVVEGDVRISACVGEWTWKMSANRENFIQDMKSAPLMQGWYRRNGK